MQSRDTGALLRWYVATLEAVVKHDVMTRVILHNDDVVTSPTNDVASLCCDPFRESRDFSDVILPRIYTRLLTSREACVQPQSCLQHSMLAPYSIW